MKSNVANRPPWSCEAQSQMGFTLVELLVVITIIVVLLALLSSALDRAIYRAELLRCAANLDGIATGVQTYAVDFKRSYPYRPIQRGLGGNPVRISAPGAANDTRPQLRNYMSMNGHLLCPFIPVKVDIDGSASDTQVYSSYNLFFGVQYKDELGATHPGMLRLGDKLEWEGERYGTLATDFDVIQKDLSVAYTSHPDWEGAARPQFVQDSTGMLVGGNKSTFSRWIYSGFRRPPIDSQYVMDDGSVGLYERVTWDEPEDTGKGRMAKLPHYCNAQSYQNGTQWVNTPKR